MIPRGCLDGCWPAALLEEDYRTVPYVRTTFLRLGCVTSREAAALFDSPLRTSRVPTPTCRDSPPPGREVVVVEKDVRWTDAGGRNRKQESEKKI